MLSQAACCKWLCPCMVLDGFLIVDGTLGLGLGLATACQTVLSAPKCCCVQRLIRMLWPCVCAPHSSNSCFGGCSRMSCGTCAASRGHGHWGDVRLVHLLHGVEAQLLGIHPPFWNAPAAATLNQQVVVAAVLVLGGHDPEEALLSPWLSPAVATNPVSCRRLTVMSQANNPSP